MKIEFIRENIVFKEFFKIYKSTLRFEHFDGSMSDQVERFSIHKSDAVAILVYHTKRDEYILVRQFRYPPVHHDDVDPWMTEIVAGGKEASEDIHAAAEREVLEEIGYKPIRLEQITQCYVSPGIMNERVTIFLAEVDESSKINEGGGASDEDEDIKLIRIPRSEAHRWLEDQRWGDAKTIIAFQWHLQRTSQ